MADDAPEPGEIDMMTTTARPDEANSEPERPHPLRPTPMQREWLKIGRAHV